MKICAPWGAGTPPELNQAVWELPPWRVGSWGPTELGLTVGLSFLGPEMGLGGPEDPDEPPELSKASEGRFWAL